MKMLVLILTLLIMSVVGCSVNFSKIGEKESRKFTEKIQYVKDESTGLCFAVVASRKTMDMNSTGIAMTEVSCRKVRKRL